VAIGPGQYHLLGPPVAFIPVEVVKEVTPVQLLGVRSDLVHPLPPSAAAEDSGDARFHAPG
jgi:hypothetical protein